MTVASSPVSTRHKLALGCGFIAVFFSFQTINSLAIPYYQMTLGVDPFLLSIAMTLPLIIASSFGPWIGKLSDQHQSKYGRRRPFVFVFPWLSALAYGMIWMVSPAWDGQVQLTYFFVMALLFYLFTTCWTVPLNCMVFESTNDKNERTKVIGMITYFSKISSLFYHWLIPIAQLTVFGGLVVGIKYIGWGVAFIFIALFAMVPACAVKTASSVQNLNGAAKSVGIRDNIASFLRVDGLRTIILLIFCQTFIGVFAASMDYYLLVYFVFDGDITAGAKWKGILSSAYAIVAIFGIGIVTTCSIKFGKTNTLKALFSIALVGGVAKWYIFVPGAQWWLFLDAILGSFVWLGIGVIAPSMLADQMDIDHEKNGIKREGVILSSKNWVVQIALALAAVTSGISLNLMGFDATQDGPQFDDTILSMRIVLTMGTVLSAFIGISLCRKYERLETRLQQIKPIQA